jgi:DNA repair exonuclease SbcCD nuclease subunit
LTARLLFVGDIHLGRRPSRLPDDLARLGLAPEELSPGAAWRTTVDRAIALDVDAVVLAGDVVDRLEDRFEAYAPLRAGVERLIAAGVGVYAIAGNHDVEALPRLARHIPDFKLIGAGGVWERVRVPARGGGGVDLLGWSFPTERVRTSPLETLRHQPATGVACLGVLHCDVDATSSVYAPVSRSGLLAVPVDAWLLGHVHRPGALEGDRPVGYLGSLVGLDPGEPGRRGPWLVEVGGPGRVRATQLALAPLRYERVEVELAASPPEAARADVEDAVFGALSQGLRAVAERVGAEGDGAGPRLVSCRIVVSGPGRHEPGVRALLAAGERHPVEEWAGAHYVVESVEERPRPDLDLDAIAAGDDPPALLARRLLALLRGGPEAEALVERAGRALDARLSAPRWQRPLATGPAPEPLADTLIRAGTRQLEALLAQRPAAAVQAGAAAEASDS